MNRNLVNSKLDKYRARGKGTYTFCQVGCGCNIAVNLLEKCENLQSKIDKAIEYAKDNLPERDYMGCLLTDEDVTLNMILEKLLDILKEDK